MNAALPNCTLPGPFRLEDWQVLPSQNLLRREGTSVALRPKVMDVLVLLASRPGAVHPAEAIVAAVWGKRYLARSALPGAICELREALGDDSHEPRYVETVAKRGYRLVARVVCEPEPALVAHPEQTRSRAKGVAFALGAVAVMAVTILGGAAARRSGEKASPLPVSLEAREAYRRGVTYLDGAESADSALLAIKSLERAVTLEPGFVAGYAALAHAHGLAYHIGYDRSTDRRRLAERVLATARALDSTDPDVLWTQAYFRYVFDHDYLDALAGLAAVRERRGPTARDWHFEGAILRRAGRFEEALERLRHAAELDPASWRLAFEIATTETVLHRHVQADADYQRSIELAPDQLSAYWGRARNLLLWKGSVAAAREAMAAAPHLERSAVAVGQLELDLCAHDYDAALRRLAGVSDSGLDGQGGVAVRALLEGEVLRLRGETGPAWAAYEVARAALAPALEERPDDWRVHSAVAVALAGLGRAAEARREAERGVALCPASLDALAAPFALENLAEVQVMTGDLASAVATLDRLLGAPANPDATPLLDLEPWWQPLASRPDFQALLSRERAGRDAGAGAELTAGSGAPVSGLCAR